GVVRAPVAGVAIPRRAADALAVAAGVVGGAGVAVVAGVRVRNVETAELRVAAVVGADVVVVARRRGARGALVVDAGLGAVADVAVVAVSVRHAAVRDGRMLAPDPGLAGVGRAEHLVVAVELRAVLAAGGGVAGLDPVAGIAIVADHRRAGVAHAGRDLAGLGAGADVVIVAVSVRGAAAGDRRIHAAARVVVGRRVAAVGRAHHPVIAGRVRAEHARPILRVAGLDAVAEVAVVAGLGAGADVVIVAVSVRGAAAGDRRIHAAARVVVGRRVAAVGRAHHTVVAGRLRAWHARPIRRVAGRDAVAELAVVAGDSGR